MFSISQLTKFFYDKINGILDYLWNLVFVSLMKYFLRRCTGLCELQRIIYRTEKGAERCLNVEKYLNTSRSRPIISIRERFNQLSSTGKFTSENCKEIVVLIEHALEAICIEKEIKSSIHPEYVSDAFLKVRNSDSMYFTLPFLYFMARFSNGLRICFLQIYGYQNLFYEVEKMRSLNYEDDECRFDKMLETLWNCMMPGEPYVRIGPHWKELGFQGNDPKTDLRGMGLLGLHNLLYFCSNYTKTARNILLHSNHPSLWYVCFLNRRFRCLTLQYIFSQKSYRYPFAVAGINLTHVAYVLLKTGKIKTHFYNSHFGTPCLEDFDKVYCMHLF